MAFSNLLPHRHIPSGLPPAPLKTLYFQRIAFYLLNCLIISAPGFLSQNIFY